ncbi:MAG: bifunctional diguanylate cyclase/phosphodiesterase [Lachnospiraceae bacterium]|nr:bifunctional diguanylate cyclase/phosphodiesterase [Lachnospiraceae bacterium]
MHKEEGRSSGKKNMASTLKGITKHEVPKSAYVLMVLLHVISSVMLTGFARSSDSMMLMGMNIPVVAFVGIFSSLGNILLILMVLLFEKLGFVTALIILVAQYPMMLTSIIKRGAVSSIQGLFTNTFSMIAIILIYANTRKSRKYMEKVREQAVIDALTGIPNRFACTELMNDLIKKGSKFAVVSIDLNNFKSINDTMGNRVGDEVLKGVANRWKNLADSGKAGTIDFIARLGGDEFSLVVRGYGSDDSIVNTIRVYESALKEKLTIDDCDYFLTACFGYAEFPTDDASEETLFSCADAAMHEIKRLGSTNHILRFTPALLNKEQNLETERKIRTALENDAVFFNLQPQFDMDHKLRGFEALARMKDTDGKIISPGEFIPIAEKIGLIDQIDLQVFRKSATFFAAALRKSGADVTLSINISVKHLMKNNFLEEIRDIIDISGIPVKNLEIEITESIMIDSDRAMHCIEEIKKMGIQVAIDDFGTGYSSLSYLNNLPADLLKIDKSFIDEMNSSESSKQYVASIIQIGHILGLKVISEGVEAEEQLKVLRDIGCDFIQGFIWGRPLPSEEAEKLIVSA